MPSDMCCSTWETPILSDMCSLTWETHIPSDRGSPTLETHIYIREIYIPYRPRRETHAGHFLLISYYLKSF